MSAMPMSREECLSEAEKLLRRMTKWDTPEGMTHIYGKGFSPAEIAAVESGKAARAQAWIALANARK